MKSGVRNIDILLCIILYLDILYNINGILSRRGWIITHRYLAWHLTYLMRFIFAKEMKYILLSYNLIMYCNTRAWLKTFTFVLTYLNKRGKGGFFLFFYYVLKIVYNDCSLNTQKALWLCENNAAKAFFLFAQNKMYNKIFFRVNYIFPVLHRIKMSGHCVKENL